jgi:hypothetical protein
MFINNIAALTELCNSRHTQTPEPSQEMNCCPISIQTNCVNTPKLYTCRVKINIHAAVGSAREICENCWHTQRHARKGASALGENGTQTEARQSPAKPTTHSTQHRRKTIVEGRPAIYTVLCYTHEAHKWLTRRRPVWVVFHVSFLLHLVLQLLLLCASAVDPSEALPSTFYPPN